MILAHAGAHHHIWSRTLTWSRVLVVPLRDPMSSWKNVMKWYAAAAKWEEILRSQELEYWYQLRPGKTVIFDNHRVLHGRSAFTGLRRICGGYSECLLTCRSLFRHFPIYIQSLHWMRILIHVMRLQLVWMTSCRAGATQIYPAKRCWPR